MKDEKLYKKALKNVKTRANEDVDEAESRLNLNNDNNVFTNEVKPLSSFKYFLISLGNIFVKLGLVIYDWIITICLAFLNIFVSVYKVFRYGSISIYKFFKRLAHQFKYNDVYGRLSYVIFGAGSFGHKQYVNGVLYLIFEIGYLIFFFLAGLPGITGLWNLGSIRVDLNWVYSIATSVPIYNTDNSLLILIGALFCLISLFVFIYVWYRSIQSGYNNYRIDKFNSYREIYEKEMDFSNSIDEKISKKFENLYKEKSKVLIQDVKEESSISAIEARKKYFRTNLVLRYRDLKKELAPEFEKEISKLCDSFEKDYTKYIFVETIKNSLLHYKTMYKLLSKKERKDVELEYLRLCHHEENMAILNDATKTDEEKDEIISKNLLSQKKSEHKILDKAMTIAKSMSDMEKTHSSFAAKLSRINYNSYAKYNDYFNKISFYNTDIKFYESYKEIANYYSNIGKDYEKANAANLEKKETTNLSFEEKQAAIIEKYQEVFDKKANILKLIEEEKNNRKKSLLDLKNEYAQKTSLEEKTAYKNKKTDIIASSIERINKLDGEYNSFASDKLLNTLKKEELRLIKKRNNSDLKYLKVNYTNDSFAQEETINHMLLDYEFDYQYAKQSIKLIKENLSDEEVSSRLALLKETKDSYIEKNSSTKFVGKAKSFRKQIASLFNDKFHITILALPILGALVFSVIPLVFSILIAFTNLDKEHLIGITPFQWVGFETFIKMFEGTDPIYGAIGSAIGATFIWTFVWAIFATFSNYFLGIIVALMINKEGIKFKRLWRTLFILTIAVPQFISLSSIAQMLQTGGSGVLNNIYQSITGQSLGFAESNLNNALVTKVIIIIVNIWVGIPYTILSTTGILMNIPKDLYESSRIDGAGPATQFFKITMPYILFVTGPSLITSFIGNFNNFGVIFFLTGGAPKRVGTSAIAPGYTDLFITYIYTLVTGDTYKYYNVASALGIIIFIVCSFISIIMYNKTGAVSKEDQFQ